MSVCWLCAIEMDRNGIMTPNYEHVCSKVVAFKNISHQSNPPVAPPFSAFRLKDHCKFQQRKKNLRSWRTRWLFHGAFRGTFCVPVFAALREKSMIL